MEYVFRKVVYFLIFHKWYEYDREEKDMVIKRTRNIFAIKMIFELSQIHLFCLGKTGNPTNPTIASCRIFLTTQWVSC